MACVQLFLALFVVPVLTSSSLLSGMQAHDSDNICCLPRHPRAVYMWQAAAALLGWREAILMVLRRVPVSPLSVKALKLGPKVAT